MRPATVVLPLQLAVVASPADAAEKKLPLSGRWRVRIRVRAHSVQQHERLASRTPLQITGTNAAAIQPGSLMSIQPRRTSLFAPKKKPAKSFEWASGNASAGICIGVLFSSPSRKTTPGNLAPRFLTGIPANPVVGSTVQINANISGNTCTTPKQLHDAVVVAVLPHTIVLSDVQSPAGGYTTTEMTDFGQAFDTLGYALDVQNFGAPTDTDADGRITILLRPG